MKHAATTRGTNVTSNLSSLKFVSIATAIQKSLCLASYPIYLFPERKKLTEVTLTFRSFRYHNW